MSEQSQILIIYTGGTIGSFEDHATQSLKPVNFEQLREYIPELNRIGAALSVHAFSQPKDSSDMNPADWVKIVEVIRGYYDLYDGFVVLHGTDTMAFTASAVSFMIEDLSKPVIFTGSQLPIGRIRTDGKENLITAIEIAATKQNGKPVVPEVCIYFEFKLYRANRTFKFSAEHFNAYLSPNYPLLAEAGVTIEYNHNAINPLADRPVQFHTELNTCIAIVPLFPGILPETVENIVSPKNIRAVILETFGSGNGPMQDWLFDLLREAMQQDKIILNITQCRQGGVIQGRYETSREFRKIGLTGGADMTREAAVTKLMHLLAYHKDVKEIERLVQIPLRGELTVD